MGVSESQQLIRDALDWCASLPEVPLYRRRDDPARAAAAERLTEGLALLRRPVDWASEFPEWQLAIERHVQWLESLSRGDVEQAQHQWPVALAAERQASLKTRLWQREDHRALPVFDRATGASRFDPQPTESLALQLPCPHCRAVETFHASALMARHRFRCARCAKHFQAYVAQVRQLQTRATDSGRRYFFQLEGLGHELSRLSVDDPGPEALVAGRGDLLAFLYAPETVLRALVNLNSGRVLWLASSAPCFVVTAAFGEHSPEVRAFRDFRDHTLTHFAVGRAFIDTYYRRGPGWARWVTAHPRRRALTRKLLTGVYRMLKVLS